MHIAGGAAVAGLGGGSVAGGAAGAGVSAAAAGYLNDVSNAVKDASPTGNADADRALGNILANVIATGAGAVVGGSSGAATASNADMYNRSLGCTNGKCEGSEGTLVDKAINWVKDTYSDPVGDAKRWFNQATGQMNADAAAMASQRPSDLIAQGTANGINTIIGSKGGEPPMANPGTVLADSTMGAVPKNSAGYVPSNATLNSGSNDEGNNASNDVNVASSDRTTHILTGDSTGGGHQWPGGPGKSVFPENWSGSKIMNAVSDIATDPSIPETVQANGRIVKNGSRDGVDIRVVIEPASKGGGIVTAFPTNVPRNPK